MFKTKTLSDTIGKVNNFISELKSGVNSHRETMASIGTEISDLMKERADLATEVEVAEKLIKTLSI